MERFAVVGVDLGGTNVRAGAFFEDGSEAGEKFELPSRAQSGTEAVVESIVNCVNRAIVHAEAPVAAIGMAVPGHIDDHRGLVRWSPNFGHEVNGVFQSWRDVPLPAMLHAAGLSVTSFIGNDANLAALGEYQFGSGKGSAKCLTMFTIGTGIGSGVVMDGSSMFGKATGPLMLLGGNHGGAELGHMVISAGGLDCNAGSYGAIEGLCQRDSIIKRAQYRLLRGRKSAISDLVEGDLGKVTPKVITMAADMGDEVAIEVYREVGYYLGQGIANAINIFAPDVVAVGGQIAKAGKWLLDPAIESARNAAIPSLFADAKIGQAELIEDAGIRGGAALALIGARAAG